MRRFNLSFIFILFCGAAVGTAQQTDRDTIKTTILQNDTAKQASKTSIDTLVNYTAKDSIIYSLSTRYMKLYSSSEIQYQTINLKSERVDINWDDATLIAYGIADTVKADSVIGKPIMRDGGDEYHGDQVKYNFQTRKGKISIGTTQMDNGYYVGSQIKKVESNVLCVADGTYTTCDEKYPHFHFESPKMKVFVRDKVVAEPVYFFVAGVPVFALPFGVFPAHGGRSSGIIAPAYGEDARYGWYLSHIGYYWAVSDYWDIASALDIYSRGRWQSQTNINYRLRYNFGGSITARITSSPEGEPSDLDYFKSRQYYVNITHNQQFTPSSKLDVNFTFTSTDYFRNFSPNLSDYLTQNVISDATYWKSWASSTRSLSVNIHRDQSLVTGETSELLPSIRFSLGQVFPFRKTAKTRGLSSTTESDQSFIELLGFSYSADASNSQKKEKNTDTVKTQITSDSLEIVNNFQQTKAQTLNQNFSFSISPKLGYFTVSPSLSFSDSRSWVTTESPFRNPVDSLLTDSTDRRKTIRGNLGAGISTSTRFYGLLQPNVFGITAFRHTVTPQFGLSYNKQIYGDDMQKYSMTGLFSVGNNFEMKIQKGDSAKTDEKIQLLNIGASTQYNFVADSMNFNPVNIDFRTDIGQYLGISGNATYNLYAFDQSANKGLGARVNRFLLNEKGKFGDLTSFSLSLSTSFKGEKEKKSSDAGIPDSVMQEQESSSGQTVPLTGQKKIYYTIYDREEADFSIPWSISLRFSFSESQTAPQNYERKASINASLSFNLTDKWQISTNGWYDFVRKQHYIQSLSITRDLHCWLLSFSWFPMGALEGYRLELKVKAPQLQDIKITKQSNNRGIYQ